MSDSPFLDDGGMYRIPEKLFNSWLVGLSVAEHAGDVADELDSISRTLRLGGEWDDEWDRFVWPWEDPENFA